MRSGGRGLHCTPPCGPFQRRIFPCREEEEADQVEIHSGAMAAVLRLLGVVAAVSAVDDCSTDLDCFGGRCIQSSCECPPLWSGPRCQVLRLKPARTAAAGLRLPNVTTWGGSSLQDANGTWHLFAARMEANCGLESWFDRDKGTANSDIVHAEAPAPDGPYTISSVVRGSFSHNPQPFVLPNGKIAISHIGCGDGTVPLLATCSNGTTPATAEIGTFASSSRSNCNHPGWTGLLIGTDPNGPWTQTYDPSGPGLSVDGGMGAWHSSSGLTNPSLYPLDASSKRDNNGTVLLAFSTGCENCPMNPGHKHVGLALGSLSPTGGTFRDLTPSKPIFSWACEDPTVWIDPDTGFFHIFGHRTGNGSSPCDDVSAHAVAQDPDGPWRVAEVEPYSRDIEWDQGDVTHVQKRERPQIVWNRDGEPVALANGVQPGKTKTPFSAGFTGDWSYTHVQLLDRDAGRVSRWRQRFG